MIYGAIIGDVAGSRFEFDRGGKTKKFKLFVPKLSTFTDDTVMTIAVANALKMAGEDATEKEIKEAATFNMRYFANVYPNAGYGYRFIRWLFSENPRPYGSFGNGSAMRTSAVGWMYEDLDRVREVAKWVAEISHNHPEGIKGAVCTSMVIWMARNGFPKEEIIARVTEEFEYDISETLDQMRARHEHVETCMDSMPKALKAFLDGTSYEDVIRNAISLGGDTDTLGAIAGSMAEAFYGVPEDLKRECDRCLGKDLAQFVQILEKEYLTR